MDTITKGRLGYNLVEKKFLQEGYELYVPVLENLAKEKEIKFKAVHIKSREEAQNAPTPITTYALFCDGEYITNEQMNDKRFLKRISK